jgi:putative spermidine/putrescine transport system ATP-binding protein
MGGHNVIDLGSRQIAVRTDRLGIARGDASVSSNSRPATTSAVEFTGSAYQIAMRADDGAELLANMSEDTFERNPLAVGERVTVSWTDQAAHELAAP